MYSVEESIFESHPILILLKDGEPVFGGLGFGTIKAKMIINTMAQIEIFFNSNGANPPNDIEICIDQGKYDMPCDCIKRNNFRRNDKIIERPYLKIWSNNTSIGFGLVKAEGLIVLKDQIEDFIRRNDR
jgi:hypothetical protein